MIDQTIKAVAALATDSISAQRKLKNFKTVKTGSYKETPTREQPILLLSWDDNFNTANFGQEKDWNVMCTIICNATHDPSESESTALNLLSFLEPDGSFSGLMPFLEETNSIEITNGTAGLRILLQPEFHSTNTRKVEQTSVFQSQILVNLKCSTMVNIKNPNKTVGFDGRVLPFFS